VLVSHPHAAQVATRTAAAFAERGLLAAYASGVVAADGTTAARAMGFLARRWPRLANRLVRGVGRDRLRALPLVELGARLAARGMPRLRGRPPTYEALFLAHDLALAALPWPRETDAVYAYEDGALFTFQRARRRGCARIWDLPLPHWAALERVWREESARWPGAMGETPPLEPEWKKRRKDTELALATTISVASVFTADSLRAAGARVPLVVTPYGFPVQEIAAKERPPPGPFTVLAAGTQDLRKGTPWLLEAWRCAALRDARLRLVGPMRLTPTFLARYAGLFEHVPHVPRARLTAEYQAADLLAFPTLGDGFGLVIQEAMCAATPVLTTRCGGGPECITDGRDGWIAPERDLDALVARLREAAADRDRLAAMGRAARARAERWTWREAGAALVAGLGA
jgi:glycosyltransferase involved in cell wall biosynthesis